MLGHLEVLQVLTPGIFLSTLQVPFAWVFLGPSQTNCDGDVDGAVG